jgi:hypothetical protein
VTTRFPPGTKHYLPNRQLRAFYPDAPHLINNNNRSSSIAEYDAIGDDLDRGTRTSYDQACSCDRSPWVSITTRTSEMEPSGSHLLDAIRVRQPAAAAPIRFAKWHYPEDSWLLACHEARMGPYLSS